MIAALFVDAKGCYAGLPDVDAWDLQRDARNYAGPHPVVAHPPCARWSRMAGLAEWKYGKQRGDDGGCFAFALEAVRKYGGVLEHPASSAAFRAFRLPKPEGSAWQLQMDGTAVAQVDQGAFGCPVPKRTWLYVAGVPFDKLPAISRSREIGVGWERIGKRTRSMTPLPFRDLLISIANGVRHA